MGQRRTPDRSDEPLDRAPSAIELLLTQAELQDVARKIAVLDLHGLNEVQARGEIARFLNQLFMDGVRVGKIIHGKGTGKLAQVVKEVLEEEKKAGLVEVYGPPRNPGENASAVLVGVIEKE